MPVAYLLLVLTQPYAATSRKVGICWDCFVTSGILSSDHDMLLVPRRLKASAVVVLQCKDVKGAAMCSRYIMWPDRPTALYRRLKNQDWLRVLTLGLLVAPHLEQHRITAVV